MRYYEQVAKDIAKARVDIEAAQLKLAVLLQEKVEILAVYKELDQ